MSKDDLLFGLKFSTFKISWVKARPQKNFSLKIVTSLEAQLRKFNHNIEQNLVKVWNYYPSILVIPVMLCIVSTSNSHWNAALLFSDPPKKFSRSNQTWNPPWRNLQCEQAFRHDVEGESKLAKVILETVSLGVFGVLIPPCWGSPVLMEVWEIIRVSYNIKV